MNTDAFPNQRILPIDIFRGITIFVMIFVNNVSSAKGMPAWIRHAAADADTMTFTDVVYPAFLFIVGMAIPFATQIRFSRGASTSGVLVHSLIRGASLMLIGFFMVNTYWGWDAEKMLLPISAWSLLMYLCFFLVWCHYPKTMQPNIKLALQGLGIAGLIALWWIYEGVDGQGMTTQWWGIIGQIGWAYVLALPVYLVTQRLRFLAIAALVYFALFVLLDSIGAGNSNVMLDWLYENRRNTTHAGMVLMGAMMSQLIYHKELRQNYLTNTLIFAAVTFVFACIFWQVSPISKIWGTPSWGLFSLFFCIISFLFLQWLIEVKQIKGWTFLFDPAANNSLLIYIIPFIVIAFLNLINIPVRPEFFSGGWLGAAWSIAFTIVIMLIGSVLSNSGIRLKL
ncbi:DUF5009 domain-containing protein [Teredinibacter sp. KSP-S5-2]|uniref:DUF5009 domain-containing protein n=1 Tax=Teredinibacter sp. KSP-S5-2 TaxID=3034506 RepID=UPI0029346F82|nr:DUF5009 domain-containing protein [Teredinibacter sp. KSP-S5-2]WNO08850.1 DUF5009 domain-containing protein [Teredinibacter sp. KSP-S5-2]